MTEQLTFSQSPAELPDGCARKLVMHMNFGADGGAAVYSVHLPTGEQLPISHQYDTRKGKKQEMETGFFVRDPQEERVYASWAEFKAAWPLMRARIIKRQESEMTAITK